ACLERGIHVLIEKPMTSSLAEADDLIARADANSCILQVGLLERFNPAVLAMREYLTTPLFIESHRIHSFKNRGIDVDVVLDLMIHDIDIILSIVPSPLATIHTVGVPVVTSSTDIANARLIFENGCTANVTVSRISKENIRRMRIFQPRAYISVDYAKKEIMIIRQQPGLDENGMPREEIQKFSYADRDALETELCDFVANVRNRTTPMVDGRAGRRALDVAMQIMSQNRQHLEQFKSLLQG
ncbi:MAG: Gfo/Idh/MocA family oxidoreductase, partial [Desulfobulbaceae bacterium]|nr:Gfo/Idh/MocA family oxidoreductase [Desulfobulbaceae bacterium]